MSDNHFKDSEDSKQHFFYRIVGDSFLGVVFGFRYQFLDDYQGPFNTFDDAKDAAISEMESRIKTLEYSIKMLEQIGRGTIRNMPNSE